MSTTTALMTFREFEALPEHNGPEHLELLNGELIRMPPSQRRHALSAETLFELLKAAVEEWRRAEPEAPIGSVHHEMGYHLTSDPSSWLQPDVSLTQPEQSGDKYYEGAPLIAFE